MSRQLAIHNTTPLFASRSPLPVTLPPWPALRVMGPGDEGWEDPVPYISKAHFEESMSNARKSVPESEIEKYAQFAKQMKVDLEKSGLGEFAWGDEKKDEA